MLTLACTAAVTPSRRSWSESEPDSELEASAAAKGVAKERAEEARHDDATSMARVDNKHALPRVSEPVGQSCRGSSSAPQALTNPGHRPAQ